MSVSVSINLPPHVSDNDICLMIAICSGSKPYKRLFSGSQGWSAEVEGVTYKADGHGGFPDLVQVGFIDAQQRPRYVSYFPRAGDTHGPHIAPPSNPFWIAIGARLLRAYGGSMQYDDGTEKADFVVAPKNAQVKKRDFIDGNEGFYNRQLALLNAKPLTEAELMRANENAAYGYKLDDKGAPIGEDAAQVRAFNRLLEVEALDLATAPGAPKKRARQSL